MSELPYICQPGQRGRFHQLSYAHVISSGYSETAGEMIERGTCRCGQDCARFVFEGQTKTQGRGHLFPAAELSAVVAGLAPIRLGPELSDTRCNCESAYCTQHGGDLSGRFPESGLCLNEADGPLAPYVGRVCQRCAEVNGWTGPAEPEALAEAEQRVICGKCSAEVSPEQLGEHRAPGGDGWTAGAICRSRPGAESVRDLTVVEPWPGPVEPDMIIAESDSGQRCAMPRGVFAESYEGMGWHLYAAPAEVEQAKVNMLEVEVPAAEVMTEWVARRTRTIAEARALPFDEHNTWTWDETPDGYEWRPVGDGTTGELHLWSPDGRNVTEALTVAEARGDLPDLGCGAVYPYGTDRDGTPFACLRDPHASGDHQSVDMDGDTVAWSAAEPELDGQAEILALLAEIGWPDPTPAELAALATADPFGEGDVLRGATWGDAVRIELTPAALAELAAEDNRRVVRQLAAAEVDAELVELAEWCPECEGPGECAPGTCPGRSGPELAEPEAMAPARIVTRVNVAGERITFEIPAQPHASTAMINAALAAGERAAGGQPAEQLGQCAAFALCTNEATVTLPHVVLGEFNSCQRCADLLASYR